MSLSQKSKSKKQLIKQKSSSGNISSRALLELSTITCASRNDSKQMLSERTLKQNQTFHNFDNKNSKKQLQNLQDHSLQQRRKRKKQSSSSTMSNQVLKELIKYENKQSKQNFQKQYESMTILNKNNLINLAKFTGKKNNIEKSQSKKLLLNIDQNRNLYKTKGRDNLAASIQLNNFQRQRQERQQAPIICSIQINCLQNQRGLNRQTENLNSIFRKSNDSNFSNQRNNKINFYSSSGQKQIQKQRLSNNNTSNYNSRRSSISLCHTKPLIDDSSSSCTFNKSCSKDKVQNIQLNNLQLNFKKQENNKSSVNRRTRESEKLYQQKETKQNQTQITPRQQPHSHELNYQTEQDSKVNINNSRELIEKNQLLMKLQQLSVVQQRLCKQAGGLSRFWETILQAEQNLASLKKQIIPLQMHHKNLRQQIDRFNQDLFYQNKNYIQCKKLKNNTSNGEKNSILLQIDRIHNDVKKKVFKKDLQDIMIFNMKVVLPSHELNSTISSGNSISLNNFNFINQKQKNSSFSNQNFLNPSVVCLYQELFSHKASKKYGMILKKQINNMNMYDCKTMNDYLKRLNELQIHYNRLTKFNLNDMVKNEQNYLEIIQQIVQKIDNLSKEQQQLNLKINQIRSNIVYNQNQNENAKNYFNNCIIQLTENIEQEYQEFTQVIIQTQNSIKLMKQKENKTKEEGVNFRKDRCQNCRNEFICFKKLTQQKYHKLFQQYQKVRKQKILFQKKLALQQFF